MSRGVILAIVLGGLIAGTIDIGAAVAMSGRSLIFILQFIASGLLGKASFDGGAGSAVLGLFLQWAMSLIIAAVFVLASLRLAWLRRSWVAAGLAYGAVIFAVMNYCVVPLSAVHRVPHFSPRSFVENLLAMLLFGVIVAACARMADASSAMTPAGRADFGWFDRFMRREGGEQPTGDDIP